MITQIAGIICLLVICSNADCIPVATDNKLPASRNTNAIAQNSKSTIEQKVKICATCHQDNGISTTPLWPNIAGQEAKYLIKQITQIRDGIRPVPTMEPLIKSLSDADIIEIAEYFSKKPAALGLSSDENIDIGKTLFIAGSDDKRKIPACSSCHAYDGKGIGLSNFPGLSGQHAEYIKKQLIEFRSGLRTNDEAAVMRSIAKYLSDIEIDSLANYISGLRVEEEK